MFYIHADPPKSLPPIPVRVSRRSQLTAALRQHARPIVIEDQELAGPFVRLLRARQLRLPGAWRVRGKYDVVRDRSVLRS